MSVEIDGKRYTWTQSICVSCWNRKRSDDEGRQAIPKAGDDRFISGEVERCSYCGGGHTSGIYLRDDPEKVPFPRLLEDENFESKDVVLPLSDALQRELGL